MRIQALQLLPLHMFFSSHLFHLVLDGQLDSAEAGSVVGAGGALVHVSVQYGLHLLGVPTQVQHAHHKVLTLHGQLAIVVLHEEERGKYN